MEDRCLIWDGAAQSSVSSDLNRVQKRIRIIVGNKLFFTLQALSHRGDVTNFSLHYRHFYSSDEFHSKVQPILTFTARTRQATHCGEPASFLPYTISDN